MGPAVTLMRRGRFTRDRGRDFRLGLPRATGSWPRAALVGGVVAIAAVTVAACGTGSGASLAGAGLAANTAAARNGAAGTTGQAAGTPATAGSVAQGGTIPTVGGSVPATGAAVPAVTGSEPTVTYSASAITSVPKIAGSTPAPGGPPSVFGGLATPPTPSAGNDNSTEPPSALPQAAQALSCPLTGPVSATIPAGFQTVAVVRCVPAIRVSGQPIHLTMEIATSSLGPLLTALGEPSAMNEGPPGPLCLPVFADDIQLALIGANGQVIEPLIPLTICGMPLPDVATSLAGLSWTTVS
jgi:hypothetical protein